MSWQEFLVNIEFVGEERIPAETLEDLLRRERERAAELASEGHLVRMWRVPGRRANWGLWRAADATELHVFLESLPYWPYMDIAVHPLARHPVDPEREPNEVSSKSSERRHEHSE